MLFNSYPFLLILLPIALAGYYAFARLGPKAACSWIFFVSLVFYGWWNPRYVPLLCLSIAFNYLAGNAIISLRERPLARRWALLSAIAANLLLLIYYKYLFPTLGFVAATTGFHLTDTHSVELPLGISFFTFTQIAYLVDCTAVSAKRTFPAFYGSFVTFFPHLIAGPILHHSEMIPQYEDPRTYKPKLENFSIGLTIFVLGLAKKILLADRFIPQVNAVFDHPDSVGIAGAWLGIFSYSLELYFDFSGYSDMAIGLARLFGVRFPLNFNSPYKSASIIEFWQRWHMTLTRFLTAYLYNPLAIAIARRQSPAKGRGMTIAGFAALYVVPLSYTFILAGIWHGAGLQFIVFGLLHAVYMTINHGYRIFVRPPKRKGAVPDPLVTRVANIAITYLAVVLGQVFFRAASVGNALAVLGAAFGAGAAQAAPHPAAWTAWAMLAAGFGIVWFTPNVAQILAEYQPSITKIKAASAGLLTWKPQLGWSVAIGALGLVCLFAMNSATVFIYFQF